MDDRMSISGRLRARTYQGDLLIADSGWIDNLVTTVGKQQILDLADGVSTAKIAYLGIGNGTTAAAVGDTALSGASTYYQAFDSGFPTRSGTTATYQVTVATGNANFSHSEFGLCTTSTGGILMTHLLAGPFTKTSSTSIVYSYALTQA